MTKNNFDCFIYNDMKYINYFENIDFDDFDEEEYDYPDFNFKKVEKPKKDKLYLLINYYGGDADTKHPEYIDLNVKFSEYKRHLREINDKINTYKKLSEILDVNNRNYCKDYIEVLKKFGKDMANIYDFVPNDPQGDYQYKCYIRDIILVGYDEEGNKHESYVY